METLPREMVMKAIGDILAEAYEGPRDPRGTWFVNNAADAGFFPTLDGLSAEEASRAPGAGRTSVAAHAGHMRFSLEVSRRWAVGERGPFEWHQSWAVSTVDEAAWGELRDGLRREYDAFREMLETTPVFEPLSFTGLVAHVAHVGYHLGAVKQIVRELRSNDAGAAAEGTAERG
jgi:hypothetical protein